MRKKTDQKKKRIRLIKILTISSFLLILLVFSTFLFRHESNVQPTIKSNNKTKSHTQAKSTLKMDTNNIKSLALQKEKDAFRIDQTTGSEGKVQKDPYENLTAKSTPDISLHIEQLSHAILSNDWETRGEAAEELVSIGIPVVDRLTEMLKDENIPLVAIPDIIKALGQIADPRAVPDLNKMMDHENSYVRRCAASALGNIAETESIPILLKHLRDSDIDVRSTSIDSLARIASRGNKDVVEKIGQIVISPRENELVRSSAIKALGKIGDEKAVHPLSSILLGRYDYLFKDLSVISLGEIGDPAALDPLIEHRNKLYSHEPTDETFRKVWEKSLQLTNDAINKISGVNK